MAKRGGGSLSLFTCICGTTGSQVRKGPQTRPRGPCGPEVVLANPFLGHFLVFPEIVRKSLGGGYDLAIFWRISAGPGGGLLGAPAPRAGPILTVKNRGFRPLGPWRAPRCEKLFLAILTFFWPFSGWKTKKRQKLMKKGDWAKGPRGAKSSRIYSRISAPAPNFRAPQPPPSVPKLAVLG